MPTTKLIKETRSKMDKTIESTLQDFTTIRTGKANPAMLDVVRVEYYGDKVPISHVATVGTPQAGVLMVQPWDKSQLGEIEKGIRLSDLGLNPTNDGSSLMITIPPLTEERRRDLTKVVKKMSEEGRVSIRNERRSAIETLRKAEKAHDISEDESHRMQKEAQDLTDEYIKKIDEAYVTKEAEIMEV